MDNGDGTFTFTPAAGFEGADGFAFTVTDAAGNTDSGTVSVQVHEGGLIGAAETRVNTTTAGEQAHPSVTVLENGNYVVVWQSVQGVPSSREVIGQLFDGSGVPIGGEFVVNTGLAEDQQMPSVGALADGGFVVVWETVDPANTGDRDVYGQRFDASGAKVGGEFPVNTTTAWSQFGAVVTGLANGGFAAVWNSQNQDGSGNGVYGRLFGADGVATSGEILLSTEVNDHQGWPELAALPGGGFVAVWHSVATVSHEVMGQRFDAAGAAVGQELLVNAQTMSSQQDPRVVALSDGGFSIVWQDWDAAKNGWDIVGRRFDASGSAVGGEFAVSGSSAHNHLGTALAGFDDGRFVTAFASDGHDGSSWGVYSRVYAPFDSDGTSGDDVLVGTDGVDTLTGHGGDDVLTGGAGTDALDGGDGVDTASYKGSDAAVTVNLSTGKVAGGHAEGDTLISIENVIGSGSGHGDTLTGDAGDNVLDGGAGSDILDGGAGNDTLQGGAGYDTLHGGTGTDTISYAASDAGVTIDLATGQATGGHAQGDGIHTVENVTGSSFNDTLTGDQGANVLTGGDYNDVLYGDAGNDVLNGGAHGDRLYGGAGDDIVAGGSDGDFLRGEAGADMLDGGSGIDWALYEGSDAAITVDLAAGTGAGGHAAGDTLVAVEHVRGSLYDDVLTGDSGDNIIDGWAGADGIDGGAGVDQAAYWHSDAAVTVDLAAGTGIGGYAAGDVLVSIEEVVGSKNFGDTLKGDAGHNALYGDGGGDLLEGRGGNDVLSGDAGADTYVFNRNDGADTVNNQGHAADGDRLSFDATIAHDQLWLQQVGTDLRIDVIGEDGTVTVADWFTGSDNTVATIEAGDGQSLSANSVAGLVSAMAAFAPPTGPDEQMEQTVRDSLATDLAAAWQ